MKAIKLLYCAILLLSSKLHCQSGVYPKGTVPEQHNRRYTIGMQVSSPDHQWTAFRKIYDEQDTLMVVSHKDPNVNRQYAGIAKYYFTESSKLLLIRSGSAELINVHSGTVRHWSQMAKAAYLKSKNLLVILQKREGAEKDLEVWSEDRLLKRYENVDQFFIKNDQLFFTRLKEGHTTLHDGQQTDKLILTTDQKIVDLTWTDNGETAWVEEQKDGRRDMVYIDQNGQVFRIKDDIKQDFRSASIMPIPNSLCFFVTMSLKSEASKGSSDPDIWNTGNRKLEKKFHNGSESLSLIWDPVRRVSKIITEEPSTTAVSIGHENYFITFDPSLNQDYVKYYPEIDFYRYDSRNLSREFIGAGGSKVIYGKTGRYFLSDFNGLWILFDVETLAVKKLGIESSNEGFFSSDGQSILFTSKEGLMRYRINDGQTERIRLLEGYVPTILNAAQKRQSSGDASQNIYDPEQRLLLKMYDHSEDRTAVISYFNHQIKILVKPTRQRIESIVQKDGDLISYVAEDYSVPPYLNVISGKKLKTVFKSNGDDRLLPSIHSERISYTNAEGVRLTGILYFPVGYKAAAMYPMIVSIYQRQSKYGNEYLRDGFFERTEGLNIRSYLERSYFVFLPDIVYGKSGTGFSALDCVNRGLDALTGFSAIDFGRIGLIGHSHGGYEVNFIATHSKRFAAYASGAGNSDLVRSYFSFNYNFLKPFYWQFEDGQYEMPQSFEDNKALYIRNSPVYNVSGINAPILLWAGMLDKNIAWDQVMEFYVGLKRNKKEGVALFYPDEGHGFLKRKNRLDIAGKISDWFDHYLKDADIEEWMDQK